MNERIKDNDSIKELGDQIEGLIHLKSFTDTLGIKIDEIEDLHAMSKNYQELSCLPDDFNSVFSDNGWIAHESMNVGIMKEAIEIGKSSYSDGERILVTYYENLLPNFIERLSYQPLYQDRSEMLRFAIRDYQQSRYYSTILVMLTQLDGIVNDIECTGLFADSTNLEIWDSISGHSSGLKKIVEIFKTNRTKTSAEPIVLPYRNGILHGRELNYNSQILALKTLVLLIYVHDWYLVARDEEKRKKLFEEEKIRENETTLTDILKQYEEHKVRMAESEKLLEEWKPRKEDEINLIDPQQGTPEFVASQFFKFIKQKNFGSPVDFYARNIYKDISVKEKAGRFRRDYFDINIEKYSISKVIDTGSGVSEVEMKIQYNNNKDSKVKIRMIYEVENEVENRLVIGGDWKIVNIEALAQYFDK